MKSMALPLYTYSLEDYHEKHGAKKKFKESSLKNLTEEEQIYLICDDSKGFYKEFYNGPCIIERYVDFTSIPDYLLDECFDFIHLKELVSERILFYSNLIAMFYANLRIRMNPLTLYSLAEEP